MKLHQVLAAAGLLLLLVTACSGAKFNYKTVLKKSLLFYEAQRSGKLPSNNRVKWRGNSAVNDGLSIGQDKGPGQGKLSGGYYDAGDHVKFGFPMAYSMTVLAWGAITFEDGYKKAGELNRVRQAIKWGTDYFIKAHTKPKELWGQVGNGHTDHAQWVRPEQMPQNNRPSFKIDANNPGSDLAGETAAAMAAASIVFKKSNRNYSNNLLTHARQLYDFANQSRRGKYSDVITNARSFYNSFSGFQDELAWAAAWMYKATKENRYKNDAERHFNGLGNPSEFSWDNKIAGAQVLLYEITKKNTYKNRIEQFCNHMRNNQRKTSGGHLVYIQEHGTLRHANNVAFICLQAAENGINANNNRNFAKSQLHYSLGDASLGARRSFVVGFGRNPPTHAHHRAASCPTNKNTPCNFSHLRTSNKNPNVLNGALVGGPDANDNYVDDREKFVNTEVAVDYNAAFQGNLAALHDLCNVRKVGGFNCN